MQSLWSRLLRSWKRKAFGGRGLGVRRPRQNRGHSLAVTQVLETMALLAAAVITDLQDYSPGNVAQISAWNSADSGANDFDFSRTVHFQVVRTDGVADYANGNLPWRVLDGVGGFAGHYVDEDGDGTSDYGVFPDTDGVVDGRIGTTWYVEEQYAGSTLRLVASQGEETETGFAGATATHDFTDNATVAIDTPATNANAAVTAGFPLAIQFDATTTNVSGKTQTSAELKAELVIGPGGSETLYALGTRSWSGSSLVSVGAADPAWSVTVPATV
ncbi:MAG: hypothetical protein ACKOGA_04335, partial [Planctomycetaceae bacterium]